MNCRADLGRAQAGLKWNRFYHENGYFVEAIASVRAQ